MIGRCLLVRVPCMLAVLVLSACSETPVPGTTTGASAHASAERPDIILVTLDTTRRDAIGCYGSDRAAATPHLDALCGQGIRFDQAVAVAPVTLPAHASLMTGLVPARHQARYNGVFRLDDRHQTLAESLSGAGYHTAAFVSAFVLEHRFGLAQGFSEYDDAVEQAAGGLAASSTERTAEQTTDAALAHLATTAPAQPMFLWVHYFDPHAPYQGLSPGMDPADAYRAEVATVDAQFGRLRAAVAARGRPTVWWVMADHGEGLGDHGERTHGLFVYDSTVHIPMLLAVPGGQAAVRADLASQVDFLPTTLALAGLAVPADLDGIDLLAGRRGDDVAVPVETALPWFDFGIAPLHALRGTRHKYISAPQPEFYDLATDPGESQNLAASGILPPLAADWSVRLDGLLIEHGAIEDARPQVAEVDAAASDRLRSLGYLSGSDMGLGKLDPKQAVALVDGHARAVELASANRFGEAIAELDRTLVAFPGARAVLYLRARLLAASGQYVAAEADVRAINARHPDADSVLLAAQLALLLKRPDDARVLLAEAMRLDPGHGGALVVQGDLARQQGRHDEARALYEQALARDPARIGRQARARLAQIDRPAGG